MSNLKLNVIFSVIAGGLMLAAPLQHAQAQQQPSAQSIIQALTPKPLTRGLTASPADAAKAADEQKFVDTLRNRQTRSLSSGERDQIATIAKDNATVAAAPAKPSPDREG